MSIFGEPLPHEDDTATSLIRREGFPPLASYDQMPVFYVCPCCSEINPSHGRNNLLRTMKQEKEMERQRIMQLNVFEERAKPIYNTVPRPRCTNIHREPEDEELNQPAVPEPPMTLDELRRARRETNKTRLIVTVHHGKGINVDPRDPVSVLVRCGAFEGQTAKVPRGRNAICTWEELFEFPYPSEEEHLEVLVVDDTLPPEDDHLFGGIVIPPHALRNRARGDEETLPVCPESEMHRSYGRMKETPMGSLVVSWYVKHDGEDDTEGADARQNLEGGPIDCSFVVHRLFQYTDTGAEPYEGGVLCLLRDTDDNCSESTLFIPSGVGTLSSSPYYMKEGHSYMPEERSQIMQLITPKKLGHVLICITKGEVENEEDEELIVVGAVPLDFEKLYHRGSAVLLVESKVKEDVLWGEIALEWGIVPHSLVQRENEESRQATQISSERAARRSVSGPRESLFLTVMRGINLTNHFGEPLSQGQVSVFACDMEGSTYTVAAEEAEDGETRVITWNQEVRFIEMDGGQSVIDVQVLHDKQAVSSGRFELQGDNDVLTVKMHDLYDENVDRGEILVSYKLIRSPEDENSKRRSAVSQGSRGEEYLSNAEEGSTDREGGRRSGKRRGRGKDSEGRSEDSEDERDEVDYDDEKGVSGASDVSREDGHKGGDFGSRKRGGSSKKRSAQVSPKTDDDAEPCYESDAPVPAKHAGSSSRKGKKSKKSKDVSPKRSPKDHTDGEDEAGAPISKRSKQISPMSGDEQDASSPPKHDGSSSRKGKKSKKSKDVSPKRSPETTRMVKMKRGRRFPREANRSLPCQAMSKMHQAHRSTRGPPPGRGRSPRSRRMYPRREAPRTTRMKMKRGYHLNMWRTSVIVTLM
ncbi:C2 domain [Trypanosoma vivax]|nr:C2 domain [Trypanosoma vivax]